MARNREDNFLCLTGGNVYLGGESALFYSLKQGVHNCGVFLGLVHMPKTTEKGHTKEGSFMCYVDEGHKQYSVV